MLASAQNDTRQQGSPWPPAGLPAPYYHDSACVIYLGDCRDILSLLAPESVDLVLTDPPYPNKVGYFSQDILTAEWFCTWQPWEHALIFWDELRAPPCVLPLVAKHIWHRNNSNRPDNYEAIYQFCADGRKRPSRVFSYPVIYPGLTGCLEATGHPTQKNEKLLRRLIDLVPSARGILDPFMGSGTMLRAAKDLRRRAIGIEADEHYCEVAVKRLRQEVLL